jgi:2-succinyl-5-enolpyruvyl-6-hydroxy-3-cyclohexene-1-carboxylate synthase
MTRPIGQQTDTLTGAEAAVEMLKAHGVEMVFGLCGDTSLPFYDALARLPHGMRHVLARDERSAAYMADGYARVSSRALLRPTNHRCRSFVSTLIFPSRRAAATL